MAYLDKRNPYNPGYVLPPNVLDEPLGRGVIVSKGLPRRTIATFQPDWLETGRQAMGDAGIFSSRGNQGVLGSDDGQGVFSSRGNQGVLGGHVLGGNTLGAAPAVKLGGAGDPIAEFGRRGAALVLREVRAIPLAARKQSVKTILDAIDPKLFAKIGDRIEKLVQEKGYSSKVALEKALAAAFANRYVEQLIEVGKKGPGAATTGLLGLGDHDGQCACCQKLARHLAMGGIGSFFKKVGRTIAGAGKNIVRGLGKLHCIASRTGATAVVAGIAGGAAGGPAGAAAGAAGAKIVAQLCAKKGPGAVITEEEIVAELPPPAAGKPFPVLPVLLIGGGLLTALVVLK